MTYLDSTEEPNYITAELAEDGILEVRLTRPNKRNAITFAMERDYHSILDTAAEDDRVRAVVISGEGPVFCSGHDLADPALGAIFEKGGPGRPVPRALPRPWYFTKPLIAAVHGYVGPAGFELTATADFIIAAAGTRWSYEITRKGGSAPSGTYLLLNLQLPMRVVQKLWMMGGWFTAEDALRWDFVQRVLPADEVYAEARRWAVEASKIPQRQYRSAKQSLRRYYEITGLVTAIATQNMESGHGSAESMEFFRKIREGGVSAQLTDRDAPFDQSIAHI